jgi:hypothetical protein
VWILSSKDEGARIEGQPDDLFVFRLNEKTGSGYLWDVGAIKKNGFAIITDQRYGESEVVGADAIRQLVIHGPSKLAGEVQLSQRRPWAETVPALERLDIRYDLKGREVGLPRARRLAFAHAA